MFLLNFFFFFGFASANADDYDDDDGKHENGIRLKSPVNLATCHLPLATCYMPSRFKFFLEFLSYFLGVKMGRNMRNLL